MTQTVAAVGCGVEQAFAIAEARRAGFRVVGVDGNPACAGAHLCDVFLPVDLRDEMGVVEALRPFSVEAVLPSPIGPLLTTVGAVHDALGLRGISRASAERCTDKALFHQTLVASGVDHGWQVEFTNWDALPWEGIEARLPVVFKPRFGSGSRNVRVASTVGELARCREELAPHPVGAWLCESLVEGPEYGADGWVVDGRVQLVALRHKDMTALPFRQVVAYHSGPSVAAPLWQAAERALQAVASSVDHRDGAFHADLLHTPAGGIYVIEYAGRMAGLLMSERMIPKVSGVSFLLEGLRALLGQAPQLQPVVGGIREVCLRFLRFPPGLVGAVRPPEDCPPRAALHIAATPGDVLGPIRSAQDVLDRGWVMTWSEEGDVGEAAAVRVQEEALRIEEQVCHVGS